MTDALSSILPGEAAAAVRYAFDAMEVAEAEIARAGIRRAAQGNLFLLLRPTEGLLRKDVALYRAHARELIARYVAREDARPGTAAEALALVSETSYVAPLGQNAHALCERLFVEVYGAERATALLKTPAVRDGAWPGAVEELLAEVRRKLARPERLAAYPKRRRKKP